MAVLQRAAKQVYTWPYLSSLPSNPDYAWVAYHDIDLSSSAPGDVDANVYVTRLKRVSGNQWIIDSAVNRVQVNDGNPPNFVVDDFHPRVRVTPGPGNSSDPNQARVHVAFYSDRSVPVDQLDTTQTITNPNAQFDAFYTVSFNGGQNFELFADQELFRDPPERGVEHALMAAGTFSLNDYIGLSIRDPSPGSDGPYEVWISFMGTHQSDPMDTDPHKSVIWSARVLWSGP